MDLRGTDRRNLYGMPNRWFRGVSFLFFLSLAACSGERTPTRDHAGPVNDISGGQAESEGPSLLKHLQKSTPEAKGSNGIDPEKVRDYHARRFELATEIEAAPSDRLQVLAREFSDQVLNETVFRNPRSLGHEELTSVFGLLNLALDRLAQRDANAFDRFPLVDRYEQVLFDRCRGGIRTCRNLPFALTDSLSVALLLRIAERNEQTLRSAQAALRSANGEERTAAHSAMQKHRSTLLRSLMAINELNNSQPNIEFQLRYVRLAPLFTEAFNELSPLEKQAQRDEYRRHTEMLGTVLNLLREQSNPASRQAYCDHVIGTKAYRINLSQPSELTRNTVNGIISEFIRCASERKLAGGQKTVLDEEITNHVREERRNARAANANDLTAEGTFRIPDLSYAYVASFLQKTPNVLHNLRLDIVERDDLAFFVIDRLYYEAIDQKLAVEYWKHVRNQDDLEMLRLFGNYIKGQVAYLNRSTQIIFDAVMDQEYKRRGGLSGDFYNRVVDRVNQSTQFEWDTMKARIRFLRNFMVPIFDQRLARAASLQGKAKEAALEYAALKDQLDNLDEHLSYFATSPLMLAMSFYMAKAPGQIRIFLPWYGTNPWLTIDSEQSLANFFDLKREWQRFFPFGSRSTYWDQYQMRHVFDLSLRNGLFDTISFSLLPEDKRVLKFGGDPSLNGEYLFFRQYMQNLLVKRHLASAQSPVNTLRKLLENHELVDRLDSLCSNPLSARIRLKFSDLYSYVFVNDAEIKDAFASIYSARQKHSSMVSDLKKVEVLFDLLKKHFYEPGAEKRLSPEKLAKRDEIVAAIQAELEPFYKLERDLIRLALEGDRLFVNERGNCFTRLHRAERYRHQVLYRANLSFYQDVHAAMTLQRSILEEWADPARAAIANESIDGLRAFADAVIQKWSQSREALAIPKGADRITAEDVVLRMQSIADRLFNDPVWNGLYGGERFKAMDPRSRLNAAVNGIFAVQNSLPENFGIFVDGVESFQSSGTLLNPFSRIENGVYLQNKRDTLLRVRRQLQTLRVPKLEAEAYLAEQEPPTLPADAETIPLARETSVPMASFATLATDSTFTENTLFDVPYTVDPNPFVVQAMSQLAGESGRQFLSWDGGFYDTLGRSGLRSRLEFLKEILDEGPLEISSGPLRRCSRNVWDEPLNQGEGCSLFSSTTEEFLKEFSLQARQLHLNKEDRRLLTWMNRDGRRSAEVVEMFQMRGSPNTADWTYFDKVYRTRFAGMMSQRRDGTPVAVDKIEGSAEMEEFRDSFKLRIRPDRHLFALNPLVTQADRNRIRRKTLRQILRNEAFEEDVRRWEEKRVQLPHIVFERARQVRTDSSYVDQNWRYLGVATRESGDRAGTPIYLRDDSESASAWFRNVLQDYVITDTDCEALPRLGDPDFAELPSNVQEELKHATECRERYGIWQRALDARRAEGRDLR